MKSNISVLGILLCLLSISWINGAFAERGKWDIDLLMTGLPAGSSTISGLNDTAGSEVRITQAITNGDPTIFSYGATYKSIVARLGKDYPLIGTITYTKANHGYKFSWLNVGVNGNVTGLVSTPVGNITQAELNGIILFDHFLSGLTNQRNASGISDVGYAVNVSAQIKMFSPAYVYKMRSGICTTIGPIFGSYRTKTVEEMDTEAVILNYLGPHQNFDNFVNLRSNSKISTNIVGLMYGIEANWRRGLFSLGYEAKQGIAHLSTTHRSSWTDIDNINLEEHGHLTPIELLRGEFPFSAKEGYWSSVGQYGFKIMFGSDHLKIGWGSRFTRLGHVATRDRWTVPGSDWSISAARWRQEYGTAWVKEGGVEFDISF